MPELLAFHLTLFFIAVAAAGYYGSIFILEAKYHGLNHRNGMLIPVTACHAALAASALLSSVARAASLI